MPHCDLWQNQRSFLAWKLSEYEHYERIFGDEQSSFPSMSMWHFAYVNLYCHPFWMAQKLEYFLHFKRSQDPSSIYIHKLLTFCTYIMSLDLVGTCFLLTLLNFAYFK
jgi:hypothetical protein